MKNIPLQEARPGMKLARPVEGASGMVLYGAGMELTGEIISKLEGLHIDSIWVEGRSEPRLPRESYMARAEEAFSMAGDDRLTSALRDVLMEHIGDLYED